VPPIGAFLEIGRERERFHDVSADDEGAVRRQQRRTAGTEGGQGAGHGGASTGTVTTGAVVSVTVTVNEADRLLPCASLASHVTVVAPNGNIAPLTGVQLTATTPSIVSVADAV